MTRRPGNGFSDGNGRSVREGDEVEYRFGARRGKLLHAAHDGEADVEFFDTGKIEVVKWHHLCGVPNATKYADCAPPTCPNGKCNATGECVEANKPTYQDIIRKHPDISERHTPRDADVNPKALMGARRVDISLLPAAGVIHGAHAMMDGAAKYNPYNWREKKVPARTYISAAMRHLLDYLDGEETAADSGVHHLGHVIGCCAIVLDAMETGNLIDDRPNKGSSAAILARLEALLVARGA